ncbi:MAG TPA: LPS export ABC transporter periplasmic protein LptC [Noviherbaspirillum sp.]|nr:LPS export ABC transporter periplasmic protein LptC [Noviherbaspirillum sp.]
MRHQSRFRLVAILAPVIALALASFWVVEVMRRGADDFIDRGQRAEPDFYVEQFNFVRMSRTGDAQYHVAGTRLTHNPLDDSYDVQEPVVRALRGGEEPMTVRAERAWINSDTSEIHLHENVHMDRPASGSQERLQLHSQHMIVFPDDDVMQTDKPVKITRGKSTLFGTGMYANNATREFKLHSRVHGTYQPPPR